MIEINLLAEQREIPAAAKAEAAPMTGFLVGVLLLVLAGALVAFFYFRTKSYIREKREEVVAAQQQLDNLKPFLDKVDLLEKKKLDADNRFKAIEMLAKSRTLPVHVLMELSKSITDLAWLESFNVSGMGFRATGFARQERAVVDLVDHLNQSPYFGNVTLVEWRLQKEDIGMFTISGSLVNPIAQAAPTEEE